MTNFMTVFSTVDVVEGKKLQLNGNIVWADMTETL